MTQRILHEMNFTGLQYNRNMEYSKIEIEEWRFYKTLEIMFTQIDEISLGKWEQ